MPSKRLNLETTENAQAVRLLDIGIEDITERNEKAQIFRSYSVAARFLHTTRKKVEQAAKNTKTLNRRIYDPTTEKTYAVRNYFPKNENQLQK
ncbi:hypothetical protein [Rhizosphaericola mali]|uniref:Uncharacterized protein n=1 Tax=Rhizosphaericola mali TaxID=2545455 RepID=A0A5P2G0X5_9BACT|nr:hypothetical protein [Rhizosphaericola mali]QES88837.1 hypothetical protein E0W69_009285 [Rhizosphaericola mali]